VNYVSYYTFFNVFPNKNAFVRFLFLGSTIFTSMVGSECSLPECSILQLRPNQWYVKPHHCLIVLNCPSSLYIKLISLNWYLSRLPFEVSALYRSGVNLFWNLGSRDPQPPGLTPMLYRIVYFFLTHFQRPFNENSCIYFCCCHCCLCHHCCCYYDYDYSINHCTLMSYRQARAR